MTSAKGIKGVKSRRLGAGREASGATGQRFPLRLKGRQRRGPQGRERWSGAPVGAVGGQERHLHRTELQVPCPPGRHRKGKARRDTQNEK